jgi:hypothetical protein
MRSMVEGYMHRPRRYPSTNLRVVPLPIAAR